MIGGRELSTALVRQTAKLAVTPPETARALLLVDAGFEPDEALKVASIYGLREGVSVSEAACAARGFLMGLATACDLRDAQNGTEEGEA